MAGKVTKAVRDAMKDVEYSKQVRYEEREKKFKPVIESQIKVKNDRDEKQDELIKRLQEGQDDIVRAIEYGQKVKAPKPNSLLDLWWYK